MSNRRKTGRARREARAAVPVCLVVAGCQRPAAHVLDVGDGWGVLACEKHWPGLLARAEQGGGHVSGCLGTCCAA